MIKSLKLISNTRLVLCVYKRFVCFSSSRQGVNFKVKYKKTGVIMNLFFLCPSEVKISPALQKPIPYERTSIFLDPGLKSLDEE